MDWDVCGDYGCGRGWNFMERKWWAGLGRLRIRVVVKTSSMDFGEGSIKFTTFLNQFKTMFTYYFVLS